jgi:hypothetical protein
MRPAMNADASTQSNFELRFQSLFDGGRALAFPCDAEGHVEFESLSERARTNYLHARAEVGRNFAFPAVQPVRWH